MKFTRFLIFFIVLVLIFFGIIIIDRLSDEYVLIKDESEINIFVKKVKYKRGMVLLNDSISLSGNCPMLFKAKTNKNPTVLGDFSGPYRLIKKKSNDTVKIVIIYDTIYFKFIDITK
nr:hypothetical protein [uncultured Allomuricauda sp.]